MKRRVVVTGLGVVTSLGRSVETFWDRILRGESGVGPVTLFDVSGYRVQFGGQVNWEPEKEDIAITPLAIPMLAGPGAISAAAIARSKLMCAFIPSSKCCMMTRSVRAVAPNASIQHWLAMCPARHSSYACR